MDTYKSIAQIGKGTFGTVYKITLAESNRAVAMKKVQINPEVGIPCSVIREIKALKKLRSEHVLELEDVIIENDSISLILEHVPLDLSALISRKFNFTDDHLYSISFQLMKAVNHIHSAGMIHRDLKPSHVLLDHSGRVKLADFGLTRYQTDRMTNQVCSLWYRAPELLLGDMEYTNTIDSWSIACIILKIGNGSPIFKSEDDISQCQRILTVLGSPEVEYPWDRLFNVERYAREDPWDQIIQDNFGSIMNNELLCVLKEMLILNKGKRLSVQNALKLPVIRRGETITCSYSSSDE